MIHSPSEPSSFPFKCTVEYEENSKKAELSGVGRTGAEAMADTLDAYHAMHPKAEIVSVVCKKG